MAKSVGERRLYFARRPFGYLGTELDREQLCQLAGALNDEKLVRLGYVAEWPEGQKPVECRYCAGKFLTTTGRDAHGRKRHGPDGRGPRPLSAHEEDERLEREEARLQEQAPLYLDQTAASRS